MVHQGIGVSLVPDWTPPWPEGLNVARIPLPGRAPVRKVGFLWSPHGAHAALSQAFLEFGLASRRAGGS
ncbi:LysR substrate binding domain protein [compost metagenome]